MLPSEWNCAHRTSGRASSHRHRTERRSCTLRALSAFVVCLMALHLYCIRDAPEEALRRWRCLCLPVAQTAQLEAC